MCERRPSSTTALTQEFTPFWEPLLPDAELHLLDAGHFALEEELDFIAERIRDFLTRHTS